MSEQVISLEGVYKIFGPAPSGRALGLALAGRGKRSVQAETGHVIGLDNVTFSVDRGEIFVVMGLSGSGKSTAIRTVNKLHDITAGSVVVDGTDVQSLRGRELQAFRRENMGMVFQHFALFPHRKVIENVAYGLKVQGFKKKARQRAAMKALHLVGLGAYAGSMPTELSGGMQQRVGLARALAADPDILLMDEAFSALDPLIRRQMQDEMLDIQRELRKTILFITHDLNEALRIGDRVCIMQDGAVVQVGTPEEILSKPADRYVAEFVQDVDQGRVIRVRDVMRPPVWISPGTDDVFAGLAEVFAWMVDRPGGGSSADGSDAGHLGGVFLVDRRGVPTHMATFGDYASLRDRRITEAGVHAAGERSAGKQSGEALEDMVEALHSDFETCGPDDRLNTVYAAAGRGLPIAVCEDSGVLVGNLYPRHIMNALSSVGESVDSFQQDTAATR